MGGLIFSMIKSSVSSNTSKVLLSNSEKDIITICWPSTGAYGSVAGAFKIL